MKYYFYGKIIKNKFELYNPGYFKKILEILSNQNNKDSKYEMSLSVYRKKRTEGKRYEKSNQNGYYWGIIIPILADYFGYLPDEMHEALKNKFLRIGGTDELPKIKSTTSLNTKQWEELMEKIRIWASTEYDINIPEPKEKI